MINTMSVKINNLHKILGHSGETHLNSTANAFRIKVFGKLEVCASCAINKAKKKKTNKAWTGSSNILGEGLYVDISSKSMNKSMFGVEFKKLSNLKIFGKMAVVITKKIQGKLSDRVTVCMFVGYPQNHSDDVYRLFNVKTSQVVKSRDLILLNKDYESWVSKKQDNESGFGDPIDDDDPDTITNILISKETDLNTNLDPSKNKIYNKMKQLKS
jgi:hypothetical protein